MTRLTNVERKQIEERIKKEWMSINVLETLMMLDHINEEMEKKIWDIIFSSTEFKLDLDKALKVEEEKD